MLLPVNVVDQSPIEAGDWLRSVQAIKVLLEVDVQFFPFADLGQLS